MANLRSRLEGLVPSAGELQEGTNWPDWLIEDYLTILRNIVEISTAVDDNENTTTLETIAQLTGQFFDLKDRVGSGDFLTSDETGFTVDSTKLSVDMVEA